ncbi:Lysozyme [Pseudolycoriella hygida]|uniref:lysozyme n=1 Tax=Pseudolycoriella hygida TaxID=35572 RepID=A0A9Q0N5K3_9DIPT|nr:Lysozyme [Pseudolycoriella hygida]
MSAKMLCLAVAIASIATLVQGEFDATCAKCLCHIQTNCNNNHPAGPYKISWPYWADGGKPTVDGENPNSDTAFKNCVRNEQCNLEAVAGYMRNFEQDCDGDGQIQCIDYIKIHVFGGYGCVGELPSHLQKKYEECLSGRV